MLDPDQNPETVMTECITVPVPLRQKIAIPAPHASQQHCYCYYYTVIRTVLTTCLGHELVGHGLPVLVGDGVGGEGGLQVQPQRQLSHLSLHQRTDPTHTTHFRSSAALPNLSKLIRLFR
jgi:hypothetical protein